jgi:hypothetical protein
VKFKGSAAHEINPFRQDGGTRYSSSQRIEISLFWYCSPKAGYKNNNNVHKNHYKSVRNELKQNKKNVNKNI